MENDTHRLTAEILDPNPRHKPLDPFLIDRPSPVAINFEMRSDYEAIRFLDELIDVVSADAGSEKYRQPTMRLGLSDILRFWCFTGDVAGDNHAVSSHELNSLSRHSQIDIGCNSVS